MFLFFAATSPTTSTQTEQPIVSGPGSDSANVSADSESLPVADGAPSDPTSLPQFWIVIDFGGQLQGQTYEELLALQERLGLVHRGAPRDQVEKLPSDLFTGSCLADRCAICLADYDVDDVLRSLPCQHRFHRDCVDCWLIDHRNVCPLCRVQPVEGRSTATCAGNDPEAPEPVS